MVTGQVTTAPGQALYEANCAACHGTQGQGTPDGPDITERAARPRTTSCSAPAGCRSPHRTIPVQRGRPIYNDAEITALVHYVASFGHGPAIPNIQVSSASDIAAGASRLHRDLCRLPWSRSERRCGRRRGGRAAPAEHATDPGRRGGPHGSRRHAGL